MQFERNECGSRTGSYYIRKTSTVWSAPWHAHVQSVGFGGQQVLHNPVGLRSRLVWQSRQLLSTWFNEGRASSCASAGSCFDLSSIYACLSLSVSPQFIARHKVACMSDIYKQYIGRHSRVCASFPLPFSKVPFTLKLGQSPSSQQFETSAKEPCSKWDRSSSH